VQSRQLLLVDFNVYNVLSILHRLSALTLKFDASFIEIWQCDTESVKLVEIIPGRDVRMNGKEQKADFEGPYFDRVLCVAMGHPERIMLFLSWF